LWIIDELLKLSLATTFYCFTMQSLTRYPDLRGFSWFFFFSRSGEHESRNFATRVFTTSRLSRSSLMRRKIKKNLWDQGTYESSFLWATSSSYDHFFGFPSSRWSLTRALFVFECLVNQMYQRKAIIEISNYDAWPGTCNGSVPGNIYILFPGKPWGTSLLNIGRFFLLPGCVNFVLQLRRPSPPL